MTSTERRRFLERCGLLTVGAASGWLLPRWLTFDPAQAQAPAHDAEEQIKKLNLELLPPQKSANALVPAVRAGDMLYVSGHTPTGADGKSIVGKVGQDLDVKQAQEAARRIALRVLGVVRAELGSLNRVVRLVKTLGMVNATPDFKDQPQVINGYSNLMVEVFGEAAGKGARSAVGMGSLPGGVAVEIESIFQVK